MRLKSWVLILILLLLIFNLGLIASIDNNIISIIYVFAISCIGNALRKRYGIEVR